MEPSLIVPTGVLSSEETEIEETVHIQQKDIKVEFQRELYWLNIVLFSILHAAALYGLWLLCTQAQWRTVMAVYMLYMTSGIGVSAGAHRLWSHRSFKAKWPLRLLLAYLQTMAGQRDIFEWARYHRIHHKFSETDADPHNIRRGLFFAHIGWNLQKCHPLVTEKEKTLDFQDLINDPIVKYQRILYLPLVTLSCFVLPTLLPWYFWDECLSVSFFTCAVFRYCLGINMASLINSIAHMWGNRPYDRRITSTDNFSLALSTLGEGWHNYHHTFPWDYKTNELPYNANCTTMFIDLCSMLGLAYDLKTVSEEMIISRVHRTGDGSHKVVKQQ